MPPEKTRPHTPIWSTGFPLYLHQDEAHPSVSSVKLQRFLFHQFGIVLLPFWNTKADVCLGPGSSPKKPERSQPKYFYWQARAAKPTAPIGCNCPASQRRFWKTLCKVSASKSTHTQQTPTLFLPSPGFKRSQMCHAEAITPLFVLVLIRLVKRSGPGRSLHAAASARAAQHHALRTPDTQTDLYTPQTMIIICFFCHLGCFGPG